MKKSKIIISHTGNENIPLPHIIQILVENQVIKMDDVREIVPVFRSGQDLSFDINPDNVSEIEKYFEGLKAIYRIE